MITYKFIEKNDENFKYYQDRCDEEITKEIMYKMKYTIVNQGLLNDCEMLLLLLDDEKLAGYSGLNINHEIFISQYAIHPDYQGKGLAKDLLSAIINLGYHLDLNVSCNVHKKNEESLGLLESFGFTFKVQSSSVEELFGELQIVKDNELFI